MKSSLATEDVPSMPLAQADELIEERDHPSECLFLARSGGRGMSAILPLSGA
jgi:hypothetical protein